MGEDGEVENHLKGQTNSLEMIEKHTQHEPHTQKVWANYGKETAQKQL